MAEIKYTDYSQLTMLPVTRIERGGAAGFDLIIETPHRGRVAIETTYNNTPMLGSVTQTDRSAADIIRDIQHLEAEAKHCLLREWVKHYEYENNL
jgi:hypothetical protein